MKQVLKVSDLIQNEKKEETKGVEFTHHFGGGDLKHLPIDFRTWKPSQCDKIIYLGRNDEEEDNSELFAAYNGKSISIFVGRLNDGTY